MQGIKKGTVLGDRYELTSETSDAPALARWIARDEKLGRDVAITVFPADSAHAESALDSARRAAVVEENRLVRVLDAGKDDKHAYVVEEAHVGAHTLADLVRFEPMHPEEARRIVGETATALEAARHRGLHHMILEPRHVVRLADGSIVVTQVAVGGSLAGLDDISASEATRMDTKALVNLLYVALTRLWPGEDIGLKGVKPAAKRADGMLPTPGELIDDIPADLDTMCRQTLNFDEGPRTPGEVARQLAPWSAQMVTAPGKLRHDEQADADNTSSDDESGVIIRKAPEGGATRAGVGAIGAAAMAAASRSGQDGKEGKDASGAKKPKGKGSKKSGRSSSDDTDPNIAPANAETSSAPVALPRKPAPRRSGGVSEPDPADATMVGRPAQFDADETTQFTLDEEDAAYSRTTYDPSFEELEPPIPGFSTGTEDPDSRSSKLALAIVAVCVIAALALAFLGLRSAAKKSPDTPAASAAHSSSKAPGASSQPSTQAAGTTPVKLVSASLVTKRGTRFGSGLARLAIDGDPSTAWKSLQFRSKPWGGSTSMGGLAIKLDTSTAVKTVKITPDDGSPLTADVYVGDKPGTDGTKIGSISGATSEQTVSGSATGKYVTIFIPTMGKPSGKNYYQAAVAEVSVEK